jgi:hypothetical protein
VWHGRPNTVCGSVDRLTWPEVFTGSRSQCGRVPVDLRECYLDVWRVFLQRRNAEQSQSVFYAGLCVPAAYYLYEFALKFVSKWRFRQAAQRGGHAWGIGRRVYKLLTNVQTLTILFILFVAGFSDARGDGRRERRSLIYLLI